MAQPTKFLGLLEARLEAVFAQLHRKIRGLAPQTQPIIEQARELTMRGGKRLRPLLLVASAECFLPWEEEAPALVELGASLELLQAFFLIHDDWMDQDTTRRGGPTAHIALSTQLKDPHMGASAAVLAGDFALMLSHELLSSDVIPKERLRAIQKVFSQMQQDTTLGQMLDIQNVPASDTLYALKTGAYTVRGPLLLGHALVGETPESRTLLEAAAEPLGIAFQLCDDLIGLFGKKQETGKNADSDLSANKRTVPIQYALEHLAPEQKNTLQALLGSQAPDDLAKARALIESAGTKDAIQERINQLREAALTSLKSPLLRESGYQQIAEIAHRMTERTS